MKQEISKLPCLPHLVVEALRATGGDRETLVELAAIASFDGALGDAILGEARQQRPVGTLEEAVLSLGLVGLRKVLLQTILPPLFQRLSRSKMKHDGFWAHAHVCGTYAERIAEAMGGGAAPEAYAAGLLHDIGKLALDAVCDEGYGGVNAGLGTDGLHRLKSEQSLCGTDHTMAGKWIAERWGLPEAYISVLWLHHHSPGSLDDTGFPVTLLDIVGLARVFAARRQGEFGDTAPLSTEGETLRKRLGLKEDAVESLLGAPITTVSSPQSAPEATQADVNPELHRLRQEVAQYRALHTLQQQYVSSDPIDAMLGHMADALRDTLRLGRGALVAQAFSGEALGCVLWHDAKEAAQTFEMCSAHESGNLLLSEVMQVLECEPSKVVRIDDIEIEEPKPPRPLEGRKANLLVLPLATRAGSVGQLLIEGGATDSLSLVERLLPFTECFGTLLSGWLRDHSERQRAEELAGSLLREGVKHRTKVQEERLDSVRKLAAGAAHEINNPLTVISGRAQLLLSRSNDEALSDGLETIIQEGRRATKVLTDLMQFTRTAELHRTPTEVGLLLRQIVAMRRERVEERGIQVCEEYGPGHPDVLVDRHQIEQVFINLILNAEEAMEDIGGTLTLRVKSNQSEQTRVIQVIDTGEGIPAAALDRIFEPFFTTRGTAGTGLGLSVCHGIVENHKGTLTIHSVEGEGTTCTITLPRPAVRKTPATSTPPAALPAAVPAVPTAVPTVAGSPRTLLLVESDEELLEILGAALKSQGYLVQKTDDPLEGLAFALGYSVDLSVVNVSMVGVDGVPLYRQIHERQRALPVVTLCGQEPEEDLEAAVQSGATLCLRKPFAMAQFLAAIAQALSTSRVA